MADDRSGNGAARHSGRWNSRGRPVLYASSSIALACQHPSATPQRKAPPLPDLIAHPSGLQAGPQAGQIVSMASLLCP
jgi:RES domain-containing protein